MLGWSHNILVIFLTLILAASAIHASNEFQPSRRGHVNLKRMVKRRDGSVLAPPVPVIGAGQDPAENPPVTTPSSAASVVPSAAPSSPSSASSAASAGASGTPGLVNSLLSDLAPSSSLSGTSSVPSSSSNSSSVSSTVTTSSSSTSSKEAPTTPPPAAVPLSTPSHSKFTSTVVKTQEQEAATSVPTPTGAAATKSKTLEVIIIIASSVGGIAILWTIFRKWKLGRSSKFNDRLQPIDWQQHSGENNNEVMPGVRRAPSSASSFHSASVHSHHGDTSNLQPIPEHDFTAGVAPVGGYADLARGPSPPMSQVHGGAALGRGYEYDNGVPLHHQAGGAYGAYDYQGATRY